MRRSHSQMAEPEADVVESEPEPEVEEDPDPDGDEEEADDEKDGALHYAEDDLATRVAATATGNRYNRTAIEKLRKLIAKERKALAKYRKRRKKREDFQEWLDMGSD